MDIIIIGAGASGLLAAKLLSEAGLQVCVLEARNRIGGRIHTFQAGVDRASKEGGAEFIHGNLLYTFQLLKEVGLDKLQTAGEMLQFDKGSWKSERAFWNDFDLIVVKLKELKEDITITDFLEKFFSGEKYEALRNSLTSYVEGYYSADADRTSSKAFLDGLLSEDEELYRPQTGYGKLLQHFSDNCSRKGGVVKLSAVVKQIKWQAGSVEAFTANGEAYKAAKVLVTVPLGVWTAAKSQPAFIEYSPALPQKQEAALQLGFGAALKILLEFEAGFLQSDIVTSASQVDVNKLHMAITDLPVSTWWTQLPQQSSVLTGWLAGPQARELKDEPDEVIVLLALNSLSRILNIRMEILHQKLNWFKMFNWTSEPFTLGAYSYSTLQTKTAQKALSEPLYDTLFFAGEALYEGAEAGTVEAALISAKTAVEQILKSLSK